MSAQANVTQGNNTRVVREISKVRTPRVLDHASSIDGKIIR